MILSERLFSPYQLADLLGVTAADILGWVNKGWLPSQRHADGSLRIPEKALVKFLRDRGIPIENLLADALRQEAKVATAPPVVQAAPTPPTPPRGPAPADQGEVLDAEIVEHGPAAPDRARQALFEPIRLEAKDFVTPPDEGDIETPCEIDSIPFGDEATGEAMPVADSPEPVETVRPLETSRPPEQSVPPSRRGEGVPTTERLGQGVSQTPRPTGEAAPRPGEGYSSTADGAAVAPNAAAPPKINGPEGQILSAVIADAVHRGRTGIHFRLHGDQLDLEMRQGSRRFPKPHFGARLPEGMGERIVHLLESLAADGAPARAPQIVWPVDGQVMRWMIVLDALPDGAEVMMLAAGM